MNYVLKKAEGAIAEQLPSYSDPTLPLAAELIALLVTFMRGISALSAVLFFKMTMSF